MHLEWRCKFSQHGNPAACYRRCHSLCRWLQEVFQSWHDLLCLTSAGAKHREEIYQAFEKIYPVLQEFRKGDNAAPLPPPLPIPEPAVQQPPPSNLGAPLPQLI